MIKNNQHEYGIANKLFHWLIALHVIGLFALGFWMIDLTYYSEWYQTAPFLHESFGLLLTFIFISKLLSYFVNPLPQPLLNHSAIEIKLATIAKWSLNGLILLILISGFLISTADFRAINVFNLFEIPPLFEAFESQAKLSGSIHKWGAYILIGLVILHFFGALKHHFIDKDKTLKRML